MTIYPTRMAVCLALAGAPVALAAGAFGPGLWLSGIVWVVMVGGLCLADAQLGADRRSVRVAVSAPQALAVGTSAALEVRAAFGAGAPPVGPEAVLDAGETVAVAPARARLDLAEGARRAAFTLTPRRRGEARLSRLWLRWRGPLRLVWKQRLEPLDRTAPVGLDLGAVREEAVRLFSRQADMGSKVQLDPGGGSEFHALQEFRPGMDRRSIDWRRSARHHKLLAKENRAERNHQLVFVIDSGRVMSEPLLGMAKLDRALNAALLLAFVSLRMGDRVGLFSFDARPRVSTGVASGPGAFPLLQRVASRIAYAPEETNFTLGLASLSADLEKRSLIVIFTDFVDATSAELMVENIGRLLKRHLVLFVVFRDAELETMVDAEPQEPDDVSRAVIAQSLLREREVVITRLRRMGVQIVDAPAEHVSAALLSSYLDLKRRELL